MKVLICGDYIVYGKPGNNSKEIFGDFVDVIKSADIAVYNQEFPVTRSREIYSTKKYGLTASTVPDAIKAVADAGFNYASLANNHIFNRGVSGINDTINHLKKSGITAFGAGKDLVSARKILYVEKDNIKIAFLNFAENEFNSANEHHGGSNPLDIIENVKQIREAKKNADFVFVIIHGGIDYCRTPSPRMIKQYRFYAESGASAIVGHHTHVVSGYENHQGVPIFYGIGNFIPGKIVTPDCKFSFPVEFTIGKNKTMTSKGYPLVYNLSKQQIEMLKGRELDRFQEEVKEISEALSDLKTVKQRLLKDYFSKERKSYYFTMFTRSNYFLFKVFRKLGLMNHYYRYIHWRMRLTKTNSDSWNLFRCETHNDVLNMIYEEEIDLYRNK
jgi:poly-gamma-glutamate synthesis protein (capsule biosynthesis protein)